ncbi:MAG: SLC26A/SulP transporter family protein [Desulfobacterales bacterium]|jgi:sulfate permease, SulP family|nr:SLC26A/SulP transporter family protein [Desulfobacterales bacterium]
MTEQTIAVDGSKKRFQISDILGGFAGSAVVLPQAMGLGVVLFTGMGMDASTGAMAGLLGAAILCIVSGFFGATIGMISAPNGPVTMLLVGVFAGMSSNGSGPAEMMTALSAILILTGIFQVAFGAMGGGQLIKYIPYPVVAGLVTGIGLLMIKSQIILLSKDIDISKLFDLHSAIPVITAILTIFTIATIPKRFPKIPGALAGLIFGIFLFQILVYFTGNMEENWVVGTIPSLASLQLGITPQALKSLPWDIVITSSLALTILATTDCLITSVVADSQTGERHNAKKEMAAQGTGQILVGLLAGLGGGGTKGSTLVTIQSGGGRWSPVFSGLLMILLMLFAGSAGNYLPISVLAGVITFVGIGMIDLNVLSWLKNKENRVDGAIALSVIATIVFLNLVMAVAVGAAIAIIIFIRTQIKAPIIHRRVTAEHHNSLCARTDTEREVLDREGSRIIMAELRGNLFFATADRLLSEIEGDILPGNIIILHFRRVKYIDLTGMILMTQIASRAESKGATLIFCHLREELGFGEKASEAFKQIDKKSDFQAKIFHDTDTAFEYAENMVLEREGCRVTNHDTYKSLEENNFCNGMPKNIIALIEGITSPASFSKGSEVFKIGDFGQSLFLVLKGEIEIRLYTGERNYKRLAKYGPGTYFGEIAFLIPGSRAASAVVIQDAEIMEIDREDIMAMDHDAKADLALYLLYEIGGTLGEELRRSAADIYRLEQW